MVGLVVASCGARRTICTDLADNLTLLRENIHQNHRRYVREVDAALRRFHRAARDQEQEKKEDARADPKQARRGGGSREGDGDDREDREGEDKDEDEDEDEDGREEGSVISMAHRWGQATGPEGWDRILSVLSRPSRLHTPPQDPPPGTTQSDPGHPHPVGFDLIVACDVMYVDDPVTISALVSSLRALSHSHTTILVAHGRNDRAEPLFRAALADVGFYVRVVEMRHPQYVADDVTVLLVGWSVEVLEASPLVTGKGGRARRKRKKRQLELGGGGGDGGRPPGPGSDGRRG